MARQLRTPPRKKLDLAFFLAGLGAASTAAVVALVTVPRRFEALAEQDLALPWLTRAILDYYPSLFALPVLVLLAWCFWPNRATRGVICLALGLGGALLATGILSWALRLPTSGFVED